MSEHDPHQFGDDPGSHGQQSTPPPFGGVSGSAYGVEQSQPRAEFPSDADRQAPPAEPSSPAPFTVVTGAGLTSEEPSPNKQFTVLTGAGAAPPPADHPAGVTPPLRRGGSSRFLTDVLVELGFTQREQAQKAIEDARMAGVPPERVLLEQRAITPDQLAHAIAERYGLEHLDLGVFKVDMGAANLLTAAAAKRYGARAGRVRRRAHRAAGDVRSRRTSSRSTTSRCLRGWTSSRRSPRRTTSAR